MTLQKVSFKPSLNPYQLPESQKGSQAPVYTGVQQDSCNFSKDISAYLKYDPQKSLSGTVYSGTINNKEALFKIIDEDDLLPLYYEGFIDNRKLMFKTVGSSCKGIYGDKKFDLNIEYNAPSRISNFFNHKILGKTFMPDYFNIKGKVGDNEVDIKLPNAKTPEDEDLKDILSVLLFSNGLEVRTFNDNIVALDYSLLKRSDIRKSKKKRSDMYQEDIKPLIIQAISTASGIIIGALLTKLKIKK